MMVEQLVQSKLVLLGEMGSGKTSLVQRFVRGQYFENQVRGQGGGGREQGARSARCLAAPAACHFRRGASGPSPLSNPCKPRQESTIGASFFTKTIPEKHVKFEIWCACAGLTAAAACPPHRLNGQLVAGLLLCWRSTKRLVEPCYTPQCQQRCRNLAH